MFIAWLHIGQYERLARYSDYSEMVFTAEIACITEDAMISTPSGDFTVRELLDEQSRFGSDWSIPIYAYDETTKGLTVGNAHSIRKTKTSNVLEIKLDSGKSIKCTKDHLFLTRDGRWVEAQYLTEGISLMPFYKQNGKQRKGYFSIQTLNDGWKLEHRFVAEKVILGRKLQAYPNEVVHHKDLNKCNNSPDNLQICHAQEHNLIHGREWGEYTERTKEIAEKISKANKGRPSPFKGVFGRNFHTINRNVEKWRYDSAYRQKMTDIFSKHAKSLHSDPEFTKKFIQRRIEVVNSYSQDKRKTLWGKSGDMNNKFNHSITTEFITHSGMNFETFKDFSENFLFENSDVFKNIRTARQFIIRRLKQAGYTGWDNYKETFDPNNHKVVSIK